MISYDDKRTWALYLSIFIFGFLFFFLRNPDPVFHPLVYAEDGMWTALGLREGWVHAFLFSRTDYFVFLNDLLLLVSTTIASLIGGGTIESLPYAIAFVSYSFFSAFALFVFVTVRKLSSSLFATFALIMTLMIPLGNTENEIIGRILQVGFFMPAFVLMLFFWRDRCEFGWRRHAIDFMIFVSAGTNPVVFVLVFFYLFRVFYFGEGNLIHLVRSNLFLILSLALLAVIIFPRLGGYGGIPGGLVMGNLVETSIARSILYPLIFPWYGKLTNSLSLFIFFILSFIVFISIWVSEDRGVRVFLYELIATIVFYVALTIMMRPGLTGLLHNYQTTFPDRYFMGINILVSLLIVLSLAQLTANQKTRFVGVFFGVCLTLVYGLNYSEVFEWKGSKMPIYGGLSFEDQICMSKSAAGLVTVQIYPELPNWKMVIPDQYVNKSDCGLRLYK